MLQQAQAFVDTGYTHIYNMQGGGVEQNTPKTSPVEKHHTTTENDKNGRNN